MAQGGNLVVKSASSHLEDPGSVPTWQLTTVYNQFRALMSSSNL